MKTHSDYINEINYLKGEAVKRLFYLASTEKIKKIKIGKKPLIERSVLIDTGKAKEKIDYIIVKQSKMIVVTDNKTALDIAWANIFHQHTSLDCIIKTMNVFENYNDYIVYKTDESVKL